MRAAIIHNPSSGVTAHRDSLRQAVAALRALAWDIESFETHQSGDAMRYGRIAAERGFDICFAVGGDGTLNEVLNGLLGSTTALGVLPLGTTNVWALEMGLPINDLARTAIIQAQSRPRAIDVGIASGKGFAERAFILSCGAGLDGSVIREVEGQRALKRRWGKLWFAYVGLRQALQYRGRRITLTCDGERIQRRVILALTSNAQLYGAMARIPPDARVDDGLLDLTLLHGENVLNTIWHFLRLGMGMYKLQPDIEHRLVRELEIHGATLPIHVDAEPVGTTPLQVRVQPSALYVLVPDSTSRRLFVSAEQ